MPRITDHFAGVVRSPIKGQVIYRDDELIGFGLRVTASYKAYVAECRVNGTTRRVALGRHGSITAANARRQAQSVIDQLCSQRLPSKRSSQAPSLRELLELYLAKKQLRKSTVLTYRSVIGRCLDDWLDKPISSITEEMKWYWLGIAICPSSII